MKKFVAIVILVAIMVVSGFAMAEEANTNEEYVKTTIGDVFSVIGKFNVDAADTVSDFAVGVANDVAEFGINTWNGTVETAKDIGNWVSTTWDNIF